MRLFPLILGFVLTFAVHAIWAHRPQTDPMLAELNDGLMAIQILRHEHEDAAKVMSQWRSVREASWAIRDLTDNENLAIDAPKVRRQIETTHAKRAKLLKAMRAFFDEYSRSHPTVAVELNEAITVDGAPTMVPTAVHDRRVVLIHLKNSRSAMAHLRLSSTASDEILFWRKSIELEPGAKRYTFLVVAPSDEGPIDSTLRIEDAVGHEVAERLRAYGISSGEGRPPRLTAGSSIYQAEIAKEGEGESESESERESGKRIRFRVRDPETGKPAPVRVTVRDDSGEAHWGPLEGPSYAVDRQEVGWRTPLWRFQPGPYFYLEGPTDLNVDPSGKTVRISRGFEYEPVVSEVPEDGVVDLSPERWINMPELGWYSGQTHIHTTDTGMPVLFSKHWPLVTRAEDLGVSAILTLKGEWTSHAIYADEYPMGKVSTASTEDHLITYGQEYRSNPYGHLALIGLERLVQPISSGALGELGGPDYPSNAVILDEALEQGATTIGAHFGNYILTGNAIRTPWPSTGFEMPIDVALGKLQVAEIYGNGGQREVWYRLLNCGFELPATAGPDWVMKDTPRTYVYLGAKPLTLDHWREGLEAGRTFITKGPMLFFQVEGERPGSHLDFAERTVRARVTARALVPGGSIPVEIVVNGEVVADGKDLDRSIELRDSAWVAARCEGAHSNPVYVTLAGRSRGRVKPAQEFIEVTDRLEEWVKTKALFESEAQKESVLSGLEQGNAVYQSIIDRADRLGR